MQPNEPNPNEPSRLPTPDSIPPSPSPVPPVVPPTPQPQTQPQSLYTDAPDYLGLQPIPEPQPPKSHKKLILIVLAVLVVIAGIAAALLYWQWLQGEPERRFYQAVETMLSQRYVAREYSLKMGDKEYRSMNSKTDFSNTAQPKSQTEYTFVIAGSDGKEQALKGEVISLSGGEVFARLKDTPKIDEIKSLVSGQWYQSITGVSTNASDLLGMNGLPGSVDTSFGNIITGNFTEDQRQQLLAYMRSIQPYRIVDGKSDNVNGSAATAYTVEYDTQKVGKLNKKAAELLGLKETPLPYKYTAEQKPVMKRMTIWIDNVSQKIVQVAEEGTREAAKPAATETTEFSYPTAVSIEKPAGAIEIKAQ